jgi:GDP-4-dehydro-6-deoxy-D-mannose reductase
MSRYLVTGASGFVSYHFLVYLNSLRKKDIEVLCIDINMPDDNNAYVFEYLKVRFIAIDLLDYHTLEIAIVSFMPAYIVHLASFSSVSKSWKDPDAAFKNNTNIFLNLVEILRRNNIECRVLSVGSSEEYGNVSTSSIPLTETACLNPINPYAIARVSQEMLSKCYVESFKLNIILTRSFNHIGTRQRDIFVIPSFVKQILESIKKGNSNIILYTGDLSIVRDFLDVRDVVRAYYLLLKKGFVGELYNVCSGKGYKLQEIIDMLSEILNVAIETRTDLDRIRPNENRIIIGTNKKIEEHTGWRPTISLRESLFDLIEYWKSELKY